MAVTTAARQQVQEEKVMRIAGRILETHYGYPSHSAIRALKHHGDETPKNLTESIRCLRALKAARLIHSDMSGEIE